MTSRKSPIAAKPVQNPFNLDPWSMAADFGRQQMQVATESAAAMARGFETVRKVQEEAGQHAMARQSAALGKLTNAKDPLQFLAAQSEMLGLDTQSAARYWQELAGAVLEMQTEVLGCCTHLVDSESMLQATAALHDVPGWAGLNGWFGGKANGAAH
jgi:hypothetical protein